MSASSKIEWTDATWNPVTGCDHVSPGCDNCYAERIATRFGRPFLGAVECHPERLDMPLRWRKPRRVFVNSVSDLFHPDVPDEFIVRVFDTMGNTPEHTYQVLTKRQRRMAEFVPKYVAGAFGDPERGGGVGVLPNVWLGVSVESQLYADMRIRALLNTPAAVRFLSVEPLLGPVDLDAVWPGTVHNRDYLAELDWVIVGGESGPGARRMEAGWVRVLRDQCVSAGVPFFFKQWGGRTPKANGRELDGRTWDEYPA